MLDTTPIRSTANPVVQRVRAALRGVQRDVMVLEGDRLIDDALAHGFEPEVVLVGERRSARARDLARAGVPVRSISNGLLDSLSTLETSPGILALVRVPEREGLERLASARDTLLVVAAGVQDPGNLGALARTAEAAGAAAIVVVAGGCRAWNEKALRGSMGSLLRLPVVEVESSSAAWDELLEKGFRNVVARTRGGVEYDAFDWSGGVALWVTAETGALPEDLERRIDAAVRVTIPMGGAAESLNVTAAAAVLLFAAGRTRTT